MRPNRNRISRLVATEMRYFHRPLFLSLLSCFTIIILMLSVLFSLLNYVTSSSAEDERLYLNISVALLALYAAAYLIHRIMRWGRSPSYSLTMSLTSISFVFSAAASFLLTRAAWLESLESAVVGGFQIYINNLLKWSFWAPGAVLLFYLIAVFVKAKSANRGGGWFFLVFPLVPVLIVALLWLAMHFVGEMEDAVQNASVVTSIHLSIMLVLAVRYAVKAILNRVLYHLRTTEDTVLVRNVLRERDGKWIQWWEKKPAPIETADSTEPLLPAETEVPFIQSESEPVSDAAPAAIEAVDIEKPQAHLPETERRKAKKVKPSKAPKVRPPQSEKPRLTLRALWMLTLAAIRRPALPAPSIAPLNMMEEPVLAEVKGERMASEPPEQAAEVKASEDLMSQTDVAPEDDTKTETSEDSTAEIDAAPEAPRQPSKLRLLLDRAVAYLKKPYSPPEQIELAEPTEPIDNSEPAEKIDHRAQALSDLVAALSAVASQLQATDKAAVQPSPKTSTGSRSRKRRSSKKKQDH